MVLQETLTPPNVGANNTAVQTYTINGLLLLDVVEINQLSHVAGLSVGNAWVSAANTLSVQFVNSTASPINSTPAQNFMLVVTRGNPILSAGGYSFPTAIV
jgi:hypothetical protein